ncbi:RICIN domain-containing protein [Streptomyces sp. NPDC094438]|uniref:RICIN domain-containing protein n=1 Tax=Streptomyces sp. NPDC094438 TaxID=3366061 RepID=UPI0037F35C03
MKSSIKSAFRAGTVAVCAALTVTVAGVAPASAASYNVFLSNGASGKCLEVPGGNYNNGAPAQQWDCNWGDNQKWAVFPTADGYSMIVNVATGKCLEVADWRTDAGAPVRQWDCTNGANQKWVISGKDANNQVTIRNRNSWMVVDDPGASGANGTQMIQWQYNYGANQFWTVH